MKCPVCERCLSAVLVEGVEIDVCQDGCGGIWLDRFELTERVETVKSFEEHKMREQDLLLAQKLQLNLLPKRSSNQLAFDIRGFACPARRVGGDFFDFIELPSGELASVLADVSGKGVSAAMLASFVQGVVHSEFSTSKKCDSVANRINELLCKKEISERFVTMFATVLNSDGQGHYINAGHNPAFLYRANSRSLEELPSGGLIVGVFPSAVYENVPFQMQDGDILVLYSDGLTEAEGQPGALLDEDHLRRLILQEAPHGIVSLERELLERIDRFNSGIGQADDITFVLVEKRMQTAANPKSRLNQSTCPEVLMSAGA